VIGSHRLICGTAATVRVVERLMGGALVNVCITSPPYAKQRDMIPRAASDRSRQRSMRLVCDVAANIEASLRTTRSYFLNIRRMPTTAKEVCT